ncbi:hypothetical protein [Streptacidiphilus sp. EB129]|uniref:hypothetical protein n=1 Tax=Streptacidiphilus sp. EB129 TaxID=3156262 RepID=UPI0035177C85
MTTDTNAPDTTATSDDATAALNRRGFDFFTGVWEVTNRRLAACFVDSQEWEEFPGHSVASMVLGGAGNTDEIDFPTLGRRGLTLRLFDAASGQWSLYWTSTSSTGVLDPPMVGRFTAPGYGEFFCEDVYQGSPIRVRYIWSGTDTATPRWEQAFTRDLTGAGGWESNWSMDFRRPGTAAASD